MNNYVVTVIVNRIGRKADVLCPLGDETCTAPSGRHHSRLVLAWDAAEARQVMVSQGYYVARVESC